jgi:hypothetical protein
MERPDLCPRRVCPWACWSSPFRPTGNENLQNGIWSAPSATGTLNRSTNVTQSLPTNPCALPLSGLHPLVPSEFWKILLSPIQAVHFEVEWLSIVFRLGIARSSMVIGGKVYFEPLVTWAAAKFCSQPHATGRDCNRENPLTFRVWSYVAKAAIAFRV